jgi:hypothetical protein
LDTVSATILYSDEAVEETKKFLNSKACYVDSSGELTYDTNTETVRYVLKTMTG